MSMFEEKRKKNGMLRGGAYVLVSAFFLIFSQISYAQTHPITFLKGTTDELLATLSRDREKIQKNPQLIYKIVHEILIPKVDTYSMAQSVLGPVQWRKLSPAEQKTFENEFVELVIRTYSSALSAYKDETIKFYPIRGDIAGENRVQVRSVILRDDGSRVPVNYWLSLQENNEWKVYDMSVEGVSLLESFRSQFASELSQQSFTDFLKNLQNHNLKNQS
jgi:phospholipid transport system substrate-binding protein